MGRFLIFVVFIVLAILPQQVAAGGIAVMENFASLQCGASPASNKNLRDMVKDDTETIVLSCYIRLGGDTERTPVQNACAERMMNYVMQYPLLRRPSTPNIVVNGTYQTAGGYLKIVQSAYRLGRAEASVRPISLTLADNILTAALPELGKTGDYVLFLFAYEKNWIAPFESGDEHPPEDLMSKADNAEGQVSLPPPEEHQNFVTALKELGPWVGAGETISIPLNDFKASGFAIVAQEMGGPIVAAGKIENP